MGPVVREWRRSWRAKPPDMDSSHPHWGVIRWVGMRVRVYVIFDSLEGLRSSHAPRTNPSRPRTATHQTHTQNKNAHIYTSTHATHQTHTCNTNTSTYAHSNDRRYRDILDFVPKGESLEMCSLRVMQYWEEVRCFVLCVCVCHGSGGTVGLVMRLWRVCIHTHMCVPPPKPTRPTQPQTYKHTTTTTTPPKPNQPIETNPTQPPNTYGRHNRRSSRPCRRGSGPWWWRTPTPSARSSRRHVSFLCCFF